MKSHSPDVRVQVLRGRLQSLSIYEVTVDELTVLEAGPSNGTYLNLAIALLSVSASFLTTLLTVKFESDRRFYVFVLVTLVGFAAGLVLAVVWWRTKSTIDAVLARIRGRVPRSDDDPPYTDVNSASAEE